MSADIPPCPIEFLATTARLKHLPRTGWVRVGVPGPVEPVAGHMYRLALLAMLMPPETGLNRDKAIKMALAHDIAESLVGDITPYDGVSKAEKHAQEKAAMEKLGLQLGAAHGMVANELWELWCEYEEGKTKEASLLKQLDKLEMLLQAAEYEKDYKIDLSQFFGSVAPFTHPVLKAWHTQLCASRLPPVSLLSTS